MTDQDDLKIESSRWRHRRHDVGHELQGGVSKAPSRRPARGEARLFSRSAEGPNHAGRVPRQGLETRERQGERARVDCVNVSGNVTCKKLEPNRLATMRN